MIEIPSFIKENIRYQIDGNGDYIMCDGAPGYSEQHYRLFDTSTGKYVTVSYKRLSKSAERILMKSGKTIHNNDSQKFSCDSSGCKFHSNNSPCKKCNGVKSDYKYYEPAKMSKTSGGV